MNLPDFLMTYLLEKEEEKSAAFLDLRASLLAALPGGEESLSLGIPTLRLKGVVLVAYAICKNHVGLYAMTREVLEGIEPLPAGLEKVGGTIRIPFDRRMPEELVGNVVKGRLNYLANQQEERTLIRLEKEERAVRQFLRRLNHPLAEVVLALREIILQTVPDIRERIKWNAPSYYRESDLMTFNLRSPQAVRLILHHPVVEQMESPLFFGSYSNRRVILISGPGDLDEKQAELVRLIGDYVRRAAFSRP